MRVFAALRLCRLIFDHNTQFFDDPLDNGNSFRPAADRSRYPATGDSTHIGVVVLDAVHGFGERLGRLE